MQIRPVRPYGGSRRGAGSRSAKRLNRSAVLHALHCEQRLGEAAVRVVVIQLVHQPARQRQAISEDEQCILELGVGWRSIAVPLAQEIVQQRQLGGELWAEATYTMILA